MQRVHIDGTSVPHMYFMKYSANYNSLHGHQQHSEIHIHLLPQAHIYMFTCPAAF